MIPEGWKTYRLSEILTLIGGGTPKTGEAEYWNGSIPWLSVVDFNSGRKYVYDSEKTITEKGLKESATKILKKGQLIISARGTVGELSMLGKDMAFNQSCYGIDANKKTQNDFLYYLVKSSIERLKKKTHGAVFDTITKQTFDNIEVAIPDDLTEQSRIASILSSLDDKIELNLQMNKTLEVIAQAIFKEWFVDFRFPGFDGELVDVVNADRSVSRLPKGWKKGRLGDISINFDSQRVPLSGMERDKRKGNYPYYGAASIIDYVDNYIFDGTYLLLGEDGSVITDDGFPILQYIWGKFWVNNHAHVLQGKDEISTELLYLFLKKTTVNNIVTGAVQPKINQGNLNTISCIIPHTDILHQFDNLILPIFDRLKNIYEENQTLIQLRDSLLPKLMTGKIRVA